MHIKSFLLHKSILTLFLVAQDGVHSSAFSADTQSEQGAQKKHSRIFSDDDCITPDIEISQRIQNIIKERKEINDKQGSEIAKSIKVYMCSGGTEEKASLCMGDLMESVHKDAEISSLYSLVKGLAFADQLSMIVDFAKRLKIETLLRSGDPTPEKAHFMLALSNSHFDRALDLEDMGDLQGSLELQKCVLRLREAINLNTHDPYLRCIFLLHELGRDKAAHAIALKAKKLLGPDKEIVYRLLMLSVDVPEKGIEYLENYIKLDPDPEDFDRRLHLAQLCRIFANDEDFSPDALFKRSEKHKKLETIMFNLLNDHVEPKVKSAINERDLRVADVAMKTVLLFGYAAAARSNNQEFSRSKELLDELVKSIEDCPEEALMCRIERSELYYRIAQSMLASKQNKKAIEFNEGNIDNINLMKTLDRIFIKEKTMDVEEKKKMDEEVNSLFNRAKEINPSFFGQYASFSEFPGIEVPDASERLRFPH
ncbi:MAG: hypothetical protein NTX76_02795 [Alphaproteobacteria bacterium]|nr:hypothetical protein [Alphaproteobacteria bacterium]